MAHLLIRHRVRDFGKWKPVYDAHQPTRAAAGLRDLHLWLNTDDPSEVVLLFEVADTAKAREFSASSDLKEKMTAGGVIGTPDIVLLATSPQPT